jgi:hypothetical protein
VDQELTHPPVEKEVGVLHSHMQQPKEKPSQVQFHVKLSNVPEVLSPAALQERRGSFTNREKQSNPIQIK